MTSKELREKFFSFFEKNGHKRIEPASLITDDPSVLFTTAGMQQFKRFYLEPENAPTARAVTIQPCVRTSDINEVGDESHLTFFEMMGNFSFGYPDKPDSYFKKEAIEMAWQFLTQELRIDKSRISASYFKGEKKIPEDKESFEILSKINGLKKIEGRGLYDNFWSLGTVGSPGGPTVEFYVDGVEVWNLVFNEMVREINGAWHKRDIKGVDTGMGLERLLAVLENEKDIYKTELFWPIIKKIEELSGKKYDDNKKAFRIIADHLKASAFITSEGVLPSNIDHGYVNRRLIRRAVRYGKILTIERIFEILGPIYKIYKNYLTNKDENKAYVSGQIMDEEFKFEKTLDEGLKKSKDIFDKKTPISDEIYSKIMQADKKGEILKKIYHGENDMPNEFPKYGIEITNKAIREAYITGEEAFYLYQTYGFPIEMIMELAQAKKLFVTFTDFRKEVENHQKLSRTASAGMFKGGLGGQTEMTKKYHTATHLLLAALRQVLSDSVFQKGSNITEERLRFDFNYPEKMTDEQIEKVENLVNEKIKENLPVRMEEVSLEEAKKSGAIGVFGAKYGDRVKVYNIGNFSREICGGPHVENTKELGKFKIIKEESSSAGIRRIKAILK